MDTWGLTPPVGQAFQIGNARCVYEGRSRINGKKVDLIMLPNIILKTTGESLLVIYQPGTWEHRIKWL
jgi:hypothetical protein